LRLLRNIFLVRRATIFDYCSLLPPSPSSKKSIWRKGVTRSYSIVKTYNQHF
jgi:hypothetical protein